jgi:hypothetical protein
MLGLGGQLHYGDTVTSPHLVVLIKGSSGVEALCGRQLYH